MTRKVVFNRFKKVVYADQIARQRKFDSAVLAALTSSKSEKQKLISVVIANLRSRAKHSRDGGRALVLWMAKCGVPLCSFNFEEALESIEHCPSEKLQAIAKTMQVGV